MPEERDEDGVGANRTDTNRPAEADDVESLARQAELAPADQAGRYWELAHRADRANPRALAGFLRQKAGKLKDRDHLMQVRPSIEAAMNRCRAQVEQGENVADALFHMAQFHLMLGSAYEGLYLLCRAIALTRDKSVLDQASAHFTLIDSQCNESPQSSWFVHALDIVRHARRDSAGDGTARSALPERLAAALGPPVQPPVFIMAGGCARDAEETVREYGDMVRFAMQDFTGTLISGGTRHGIGDIAGSVIERADARISGMCWLPEIIPDDVTVDGRYDDRRTAAGACGFSPLEPMRSWATILASGIDPRDVKLLGINGGRVAAFEYHFAAALGCTVAVVRGSGREADRLLREQSAPGNERIHFLPADAETLRAFVNFPPRTDMKDEEVAAIAMRIERAYQDKSSGDGAAAGAKRRGSKPEMQHSFDESNRQQTAHIDEKLRRIGLRPVKAEGSEPKPLTLTEDQVELLAEIEHGRWVVERTLAGWKLGPRDDAQRRRPQLIGWNDPDFPDSEKEKDRDAVRLIPELLNEIGYEVAPIDDAKDSTITPTCD